MALLGWFPFLAIATSCAISGWLSDWLIARGKSPTLVRKGFAGVGLSLATVLIAVAVIPSDRAAMAILAFACIAFGMYTSNLFAITQALAGPHAAGKWTSFQNGFGNLAGVLAPWLTGRVVDETGHFYVAFLVAAGFALLGAFNFVFGVGPVRELQWRKRAVT